MRKIKEIARKQQRERRNKKNGHRNIERKRKA
jgi:hypothetical protein